jgi:hypothetical protein
MTIAIAVLMLSSFGYAGLATKQPALPGRALPGLERLSPDASLPEQTPFETETRPFGPKFRSPTDEPPRRLTSDSTAQGNASVIRLQNSELLAAYDESGTLGGAVIDRRVLRRSTDNGETWSGPESLVGGGRSTPRLLQAQDGTVWVFYVVYLTPNSTQIGYCKSSDNGHSWSAEQILPASAGIHYSVIPFEPAPAKILVFYTAIEYDSSGYANVVVRYQTSTDNGNTWLGVRPLEASPGYRILGSVVQDPSTNQLWAFYTYLSRGISFKTSTDLGETWSTVRRVTTRYGSIDVRVALDAQRTFWLAVSYPFSQHGTSNYDILFMTSTDTCATWSDTTRVTRYMGYDYVSALVLVNDTPWVFFSSDRWANFDVYYGPLASLKDPNPPPWWAGFQPNPWPRLGEQFAPLGFCLDESGVTSVTLVYTVDGQPQADLPLYDDGAHGDLSPGDGWYGNFVGPYNSDRLVRLLGQFRIVDSSGNTVVAPMAPQLCAVPGVHDTGNLWLYIEPLDGRDGPNLYYPTATGYPSCEWPGGSGNNYLYESHAWAGAIVGSDTLVSDLNLNSGACEWTECPDDTMYWRPGVSDLDSRIRVDDGRVNDGRPIGIEIAKRSLTWHGLPYSDFIIQEYVFENTGVNGSLSDVYFGFAYDFDLIDGSDDLASCDSARSLSYMYDNSSPGYIGVRMLSHAPRSHTWWTLATDPMTDAERYQILVRNEFMPPSTTAADHRVFQSVGPFNLAVGDTVKVVVGIVIGAGESGLKEHADTMKAVYDRGYTVAVADRRPTPPVQYRFALDPIHPTPMCRDARINYQLSSEDRVSLKVHGIDGRLMRTLVNQTQQPGCYTVQWDGRDEQGVRVSDGIYFCRLAAGKRKAIRKLIVSR